MISILSKKEKKFRKFSNKFRLYEENVNYYIMQILKLINIIKKLKKYKYHNIIKILLNKMQIILEKFFMKIVSGVTLQS